MVFLVNAVDSCGQCFESQYCDLNQGRLKVVCVYNVLMEVAELLQSIVASLL